MPKCSRCGRKGFFLKLDGGLCSECQKIVLLQQEVDNLTKAKSIIQSEFQEVEERLKNAQAEFSKIESAAKESGMKLHAALHSCTTMNENGVQ